jgi:hypothetical protein
MRTVVSTLAQQIGTQRACEVLVYPRSSYYRHQRPAARPDDSEHRRPAVPPRALSAVERESVRETLNSDLLDRVTFHSHILEFRAESFRFKQQRNDKPQT